MWSQLPGLSWPHCIHLPNHALLQMKTGLLHPQDGKEKRSLDWIWCNNPEWIQSLLFWESKVSDHKVVQFELQATERKAPHCILIPTRKWHKPTDVEIDVWIAALKDAWGPTKTFPLTGDADADWKLFCSKAENMHLEALRTGGTACK